MTHHMRCFGCQRELADSCPEGRSGRGAGTPLDGTYWRSRGNYGSEIIDDPLERGPALEIYVCDGCLRARGAEGGFVYTVTRGALPHDDVYESGIKLP